jgi:transcriptional regulator with XRE-family HTH domain
MSTFDRLAFRAARERQGLSRVKLAARAGRSYGLTVKIEQGHIQPSIASLAAFADALGTPPGDFFTSDSREPVAS